MVKEIKNILVSQNEPVGVALQPYKTMEKKYHVKFSFCKFFEVVTLSNQEYRAQRIHLLDYSAVIMTSKMAVDSYFHFAKEMRITIPDEMKYFCITESVANYLQTYIQYRKRKIFPGKVTFDELTEVIAKHKDEKFLFPCAADASQQYFKRLDAMGIEWQKIVMYRSQPKDVSDINIKKYDMVCLFSPVGVKSFKKNFPKMTSDDICFAALGKSTQNALYKAKMKITINAPTIKCPSMMMAMENFFENGGLKGKLEKQAGKK